MKNRSKDIYKRVCSILEKARSNVARAIHSEMVFAYWHIGREIVEEEQRGRSRAEYGKRLLEKLASQLSEVFGKGFDESNLRNIRAFYLTYPKCDALRHELSWTHFPV